MNRILLFCASGALFGCRPTEAPSGEAITLSYSTSQESKVGALTAGDEVAVWARIEGTESYFLEGAKYGVGSDGQSLQTTPASYYPETKQAVNFYAYFPYHTGSFGVPTDQSTAVALKQADLCWATASSTPVHTPVSLQFNHLFARLIVQTNEPTEKIACQVVPNGTLNPATGQFSLNSTKSEVSTTKNELILPVQPLSRLIITVSGVEYVFEGSINLQAGQTTTINLTLNPSTKTATLNGSSTTAWTTSNQNGTPEQTVSNILTLHWANYVPQGITPDKITLTINNTDYTINSGITYANQAFTVPFVSDQLRYPYTISKITFYSGSTQALPSCSQLLGATVYKSATQTLGIKDQANAVLINGLWWATGYLIATGPQGAAGIGGCTIGEPGDGGLYFQYGSMIGYKGGNQVYGGSGVGMPQAPLTTNGTYWNGSAYSWASDAMVWPLNMSGTPSSWAVGKNYGLGDPCTYYLGSSWRLPTTNELMVLCNNNGGAKKTYSWANCLASWTTTPVAGGNFADGQLFFAASGTRYYTNGSFYHIAIGGGYCWTNSPYDSGNGYNLTLSREGGVIPQCYNPRSDGFPARCVRDA